MLTSLGNREPGGNSGLFADYLVKPIKPSQLCDSLVKVLAGGGGRKTIGSKPASGSEFDSDMGRRLPLRILLTEDNVTNQVVALRLLARLGYRADVAGNGLEALAALEDQRYDVALMDVQMPEMDGLEATKQINGRWDAQKRPYIVAMTANALKGDRESFLAAGMDDYVSKPIRVNLLIEALERAAAYRHVDLVSETAVGIEPEIDESKEESGSEEIVNLDRLRQLAGGDDEFLIELIQTFLEDAPQLMEKMRTAVSQNDSAALRLTAHSLKSNAADFGAMILAGQCQELESMGKSENLNGAFEILTEAEGEFAQVQSALLAMLKEETLAD